MVFIEISSFTQALRALLTDEDYGAFQRYLSANPKAGDVIQGTGGLRKVRWNASGRGKSGGVRVIYHWVPHAHQIRLLLVYPKSRKADLNATEKRLLKQTVEKWND